MDILTKIVAKQQGTEWLELHWIAHDDHIEEYLIIRDTFQAWQPEKFTVNVREIEVPYPHGCQTLLLGEWYGQRSNK